MPIIGIIVQSLTRPLLPFSLSLSTSKFGQRCSKKSELPEILPNPVLVCLMPPSTKISQEEADGKGWAGENHLFPFLGFFRFFFSLFSFSPGPTSEICAYPAAGQRVAQLPQGFGVQKYQGSCGARGMVKSHVFAFWRLVPFFIEKKVSHNIIRVPLPRSCAPRG